MAFKAVKLTQVMQSSPDTPRTTRPCYIVVDCIKAVLDAIDVRFVHFKDTHIAVEEESEEILRLIKAVLDAIDVRFVHFKDTHIAVEEESEEILRLIKEVENEDY